MTARMARIVVSGLPHHVIQRGNRRQKVFFNDDDRKEYLKILEGQTKEYHISIWAYCLMENHVHLIVVPSQPGDLAKAIGETHKRYTRMINFREGWRGYLWEGRFKSFVLDEKYVYAAIRYVERNPVRAKIVQKAEGYPWSSAKAHVQKKRDPLLSDFYLLEELEDWSDYLRQEDQEEDLKLFRRHGSVGRPLGRPEFLRMLGLN